ncbi:MAG: MerR family transcriptional regulator [Acidimicrobiales bacterium]
MLTPAVVNPQSGYRFYTAEQLHRLHRILVLRDLGLPLAEIAEVLSKEVTNQPQSGRSGRGNPSWVSGP